MDRTPGAGMGRSWAGGTSCIGRPLSTAREPTRMPAAATGETQMSIHGVDHINIRTHDLERSLDRQLIEPRRQLDAGLGIALAPPPRGNPRRFDRLINPRGRQLAQQLPKQRAQPGDIAPQRTIFGSKVNGFGP